MRAPTGKPPGRPRKVGPFEEGVKGSPPLTEPTVRAISWQTFFIQRINTAPFVSYDLDFDLGCPEIAAHLSRQAYIDYYTKSGGEFWTRLTMALKPKVIVELGTAFGLRTNLIGKLNPQAKLTSVDNLSPYPLNDLRVETGYIARMNKVPFTFVHGKSWETVLTRPFNLCFIDTDHTEEAAHKDADWAWENRDPARFCIVWDDFSLDGVYRAVGALCEKHNLLLQTRGGMAVVGSQDWLK